LELEAASSLPSGPRGPSCILGVAEVVLTSAG
jgi:hypothetical protein